VERSRQGPPHLLKEKHPHLCLKPLGNSRLQPMYLLYSLSRSQSRRRLFYHSPSRHNRSKKPNLPPSHQQWIFASLVVSCNLQPISMIWQ
jgi:hypothetical protein